jgi:predicted DNA-binding transcriptional regulator AlpA
VENPEFELLLPLEVEKITRLGDQTRRRLEERGLFPARVRIAPRRVAWRNAEIQVWLKDPEGYSTRRSQGDSGLCQNDLAEDL